MRLFSSLRARLLLLVLMAVIPALGLIAYTTAEQQSQAIRESQEEALRLVRVAANTQQEFIDSSRQLLLSLAQLPEVRSGDSAPCGALLDEFLQRQERYANLGVADATGDVFCSALPLDQPVNISDRAYFQRAVHTGDFAVGDYQIGRITAVASINFGYPILDDMGQVQRLVFAALDLDWLNQFAAGAELPEGSTLTVIDRNGTVLVRQPDPEDWVGQSFPEAEILQPTLERRGEGITEAVGLDGVPRLYAFAPLGGGLRAPDVYVYIGIPKSLVLAPASRTLVLDLIGLGLVALLALEAAWVGGDRFLLRPIKALISATKRLASGDLGARTALGDQVGEVGQLARTFDQMAESLQRKEAEREKAEAQVRRQLERLTALRNIDMAITASLDLQVTLSVFLDQVVHRLGIDAADVLLLTPHTQTLKYAAGRGFRTAVLENTQLKPGEGYAGLAVKERRMVSIADATRAPDGLTRAPIMAREGFISYYGAPLVAKGQVKGVLEIFHRSLLEPDQEWLDFLDALAGQAAIAIDNAALFDDLQRSHVELTLAYDTTLEGWVRALDLRDKEIEGHIQRVTQLTLRLARALGIKEEDMMHLRRGAMLHDIGKMAVPDSILLKPGPLTPEEWEVIRRHPEYGYELLSPIDFLRPALDIVYCHHEKWDGTGYPRRLKGEEIPLAARIFALTDVWDSLQSDRPYRPAWTKEKALEYVKEQARKHFDPSLVPIFLEIVKGA